MVKLDELADAEGYADCIEIGSQPSSSFRESPNASSSMSVNIQRDEMIYFASKYIYEYFQRSFPFLALNGKLRRPPNRADTPERHAIFLIYSFLLVFAFFSRAFPSPAVNGEMA